MGRILSAGLIILLTLGGLSFSTFAQDLEAIFAQQKQLAKQGDARAQAIWGTMYYAGLGVPENAAEAVKWYRMATLFQDNPSVRVGL